MDFKIKYIKYKNKYLNLKKIYGGSEQVKIPKIKSNNDFENKLLEMTILAGLGFDLPLEQKEIFEAIPSNTFGVFVTVKRKNIIPDYNIHGCIGNWDNNFKRLEPNSVFKISKSVSYSATWEDSRAEDMNNIKSILQDGNTIYELDFMLLPVLEINPDTGVISNGDIFNNNKYGLIYSSGKSRATYLPYVFPNSTWDNIKKKLIRKSNKDETNSLQNVSFKSYTIKQIKTDLFTFIKNLSYVQNQFIKWIESNYGNSIPYMRSNNKIIRDEKQYVRNIATINDILQFKNILSNQLLKSLEIDLEKYYLIFKKDPLNMRQASSFLLIIKPYYDIKKYLFTQLSDLEPKFERGEVLISLLYVTRDNKENDKMNDNFNSMIRTIELKETLKMDDIFELNWHSKFAFVCFKKKFKNKTELSLYSTLLFKKIKYLFSYDLNNLETNYLAVFFEALSSLYNLLESKEDIKDMITKLFCKLMERFENGLFKFTDNSARLDITGHVLNGFFALK